MNKSGNERITILGATGSVGRQSIEVAREMGLAVDCLTANRDVLQMEALVREFRPRFAVMADAGAARDLAVRIGDTDTRVSAGEAGITSAIADAASDVVINAIIGEAGLLPTLAAIKSSRRLGLANKESLVIAGELVMREARERGCTILPVDSEHSAIFQCLHAGRASEVRRIFLTASGGPFRGYSRDRLASVTCEQVLAHPTWKMGAKITVDSASLMNKGFEVIEAVHLFGVSPEQITVVVHPESIIHSAVEYIDSAVIAQLSVPDMRLCVQYAVTYPARIPGLTPPLDLFALGGMTFETPDTETFPLLSLAFRAIRTGGALPAVLNAANEVAVAAHLAGDLSFVRIFDVVGETVERHLAAGEEHTLDGILACDRAARETAKKLL